MNNKEVVKTIRHIFDQHYFLREECKADSLLRIEELFSCEGCIMSSIENTAGDIRDIMCPYVWSREVKILR